MDTDTLVENRIEDGQKLAAQLIRDGFDVSAVFWAQASAEGSWYLYLVSASAGEGNMAEGYRAVHTSLQRLSDTCLFLSEIKLVSAANPLASKVLKVMALHPNRLPMRFRGNQLGGSPIEEAYLYPPPELSFNGLEEIKRRFPSAEIFSVTVPFQALAVQAFLPLTNRVNDEAFEGKASGTLLFLGPRGSSENPLAKLVFVYRPEGWNKLFRADTQTWEEVRHATTGQPLYASADFEPLAAMKTKV